MTRGRKARFYCIHCDFKTEDKSYKSRSLLANHYRHEHPNSKLGHANKKKDTEFQLVAVEQHKTPLEQIIDSIKQYSALIESNMNQLSTENTILREVNNSLSEQLKKITEIIKPEDIEDGNKQ
jgi:hypothetical protein